MSGQDKDEKKTHRVQFDIDNGLYERSLPYIKKKGAIGVFGLVAFEEWVNRREGQEKRTGAKIEETIRRIVREELGK